MPFARKHAGRATPNEFSVAIAAHLLLAAAQALGGLEIDWRFSGVVAYPLRIGHHRHVHHRARVGLETWHVPSLKALYPIIKDF